MNDTEACSFYRCFMPALWLNKLGIAEAWCSYNFFSHGKKAEDYSLFYSGELLREAQADNRKSLSPYEFEEEFIDFDIVIYQRQSNPSALSHLRMMSKLGKRVFVEHDDWILGDCGSEHINEVYADPDKQLILKQICNEADGVICSTDFLGNIFKEFNDNVLVCSNSIDPDMWTHKDKIILEDIQQDISIGFAGSLSHARDFIHVPLDKITKLASTRFLGFVFGGISGIEFTDWVHLRDYPLILSHAFRIGLAPLRRNDFNASRSNLKWLEYSMAGIVTVAEDFGPYKIIRDGVDGILVNGNWVDAIQSLISQPELVHFCILNAQERIRKDHSIQTGIYQWADALIGKETMVNQ